MKPFVLVSLIAAPPGPVVARGDAAPPVAFAFGGNPIAGLCMLSAPAIFAKYQGRHRR
jgi:hypothetical protein